MSTASAPIRLVDHVVEGPAGFLAAFSGGVRAESARGRAGNEDGEVGWLVGEAQ